MSVRRACSALLLLATVICGGLALALLTDNPTVATTGSERGDTYQCLAPWDTVKNGADNHPGGEPPPDAEIIATNCRHAGYARFDQAYRMGAIGLIALGGWTGAALSRRRGSRASLVVTIAAISVVAGFSWAGWERGHPSAFANNGSEQRFDKLPVEKSIYVGVNWPGNPSRDVAIETARPMVARDTANSSIEVVICVPREGADPLGSALDEHVDDSCADLVPIRAGGSEVRLVGQRKDQVLIKVTTYRQGEVAVNGVELVYRDGWRRGRQEVVSGFSAMTPAR